MINAMDITAHDQRVIRCRMLGHEIDFSYCRQVGSGLPCRKILDCWFERFDIQEFIQQYYAPEQIQQLLEPPKPKITSLVDLIHKAQKAIDPKKPQ